VTNDGYDHNSPAWSPDGRSVAVRRQLGLSAVIANKQDHGAPTDVVTFAVDGSSPPRMTNLTADWDLLPGAPGWSPDGRSVYFSAGIGGNEHLVRVASTGGAVAQVTTGDRQLAGFSPSAQWETMAYVGGDSTHPDELFTRRRRRKERHPSTTPETQQAGGSHLYKKDGTYRVGASARLRSGARLAADSRHARRPARRLR
jgi:Tol biopolymer transport system component